MVAMVAMVAIMCKMPSFLVYFRYPNKFCFIPKQYAAFINAQMIDACNINLHCNLTLSLLLVQFASMGLQAMLLIVLTGTCLIAIDGACSKALASAF